MRGGTVGMHFDDAKFAYINLHYAIYFITVITTKSKFKKHFISEEFHSFLVLSCALYEAEIKKSHTTRTKNKHSFTFRLYKILCYERLMLILIHVQNPCKMYKTDRCCSIKYEHQNNNISHRLVGFCKVDPWFANFQQQVCLSVGFILLYNRYQIAGKQECLPKGKMHSHAGALNLLIFFKQKWNLVT